MALLQDSQLDEHDLCSPSIGCPFGSSDERAAADVSPLAYIHNRAFWLQRGCKTAVRASGETPCTSLVGAPGFEPGTSSLSETRSNQLSYAPTDQRV